METQQSESVQWEAIKARAYYFWLERGCPFGSPEIDWYRAEEEVQNQGEAAPESSGVIAVAEAVGSALGSVAGLISSATKLIHPETTADDVG